MKNGPKLRNSKKAVFPTTAFPVYRAPGYFLHLYQLQNAQKLAKNGVLEQEPTKKPRLY
jgi:hypothetical protein